MIKSLVIIALVFSAWTTVGADMAQAQSSEMVCAQVMPCGDNGEVLAPFNTGACAEQYEQWCQRAYLNTVDTQLAQCSQASKRLNEENKQLKERVKRLTRQLKTAAARKR